MRTICRSLHKHTWNTFAAVSVVALLGFLGCAKPAAESKHAEDQSEHAHEHELEGPHGGHIIELGTEEHHAELTHDEATHTIGVYMLGRDAKTAVPIEAESVTINVALDGKPSQYKLPAVAQPGDSGGKVSYFAIVSEPLCDVICGESPADKMHAQLSVTIDGAPHVAAIEIEPHEHEK